MAIVKLLVAREVLNEEIKKIPCLNQIISGYFGLIKFLSPINNLNLLEKPQ
jgi:hypothetical protein